MRLLTFTLLSLFTVLVAGHARIKIPKPLDAPAEDPTGNAYNAPLSASGSDFPCKNLHTQTGIDKTPTQSWAAGSVGLFEILGHVTSGEGALAAHSGGSCQASISFDNGITWRVMHTYHGGCPRDVPLNSNLAGSNQTFTFTVPPQAKSGVALFSWTWIAVSGNRDEFYMNCASVKITGTGTSTLDDYPNMYVGEMNIPGQIASGECRSTAGTAMVYPDPGPADRVTVSPVAGIPFKAPTGGQCFAPGGKAPVPSVVTSSVAPTGLSTISTPVMSSATVVVPKPTTPVISSVTVVVPKPTTPVISSVTVVVPVPTTVQTTYVVPTPTTLQTTSTPAPYVAPVPTTLETAYYPAPATDPSYPSDPLPSSIHSHGHYTHRPHHWHTRSITTATTTSCSGDDPAPEATDAYGDPAWSYARE